MRHTARVFNGKRYEWKGSVTDKGAAKSMAARWRKDGYLVRVVDIKDRPGSKGNFFSGAWHIFVRKP